MQYGVDEWWPPQAGDIVYHDWGACGGTLLRVNEVHDSFLMQIHSYSLICVVLHDYAGEFGKLIGDTTTLIVGATLVLTKSDLLGTDHKCILISRLTKFKNLL